MSHSTATDQAVQARAAAALAALLGENPDAPIVSWSLYPGVKVLPNLVGQVRTADQDPRATVAAWGRILGAEIVETPKYDADDEWTDIRVETASAGVRIEVWAMADRVEAPAVAA